MSTISNSTQPLTALLLPFTVFTMVQSSMLAPSQHRPLWPRSLSVLVQLVGLLQVALQDTFAQALEQHKLNVEQVFFALLVLTPQLLVLPDTMATR